MTLLWLLPGTILVVGTLVAVVAARRTAGAVERTTLTSRAFTDDLRSETTALRSELQALDDGVRMLRRRAGR